MSRAESAKRSRLPVWRTAGLSLVLLAVTLAVIGLVQALIHADTLTTRLIGQSRLQSRQLADTTKSLFNEQVKSALRRVADEFRLPTGHPPWQAPDFPRWVDGIYLSDGETIRTVEPPRETLPGLVELVEARLLGASSEPTAGDRVDMVYDRLDSIPIVLACLRTHGPSDEPIVVVGRIHLAWLKTDLAEPLLGITTGLEFVSAAEANPTLSHPMSGALRFWAIQPTQAFQKEQQSTVMWQTLGYISLTVLSLLTLLTAIWFLLRVARQERALAEMKSNFVADVSHELKTPLALIHLFGETLQSGRVKDEEKRQEYYAVITRESTRLTNLINNILDFSRIDAGHKDYTLRPIDVGELACEVYNAYRLELDHNGFEHQLDMEPGLPMVDADRDSISQAILNLISNAIKYSKEERYLHLDLRSETRRGRHGVLISVHDHGIGISPDDRAHLFDGFFRSLDRKVRERRGTGIGLSLVKRIVDGHNGFLIVESRLVKGSTFRIFLPASKAGDEETADPATGDSTAEDAGS